MKKIFLIILVGLTLCSCSSSKKEDKRPMLTVSIAPLHYVVEAITGDLFQIKVLMPRGMSPETYDPTPRQMADLSSSEALFCVGTLQFEQVKIPQITSSVPHLSVVNLSENIEPLFTKDHHHDNAYESIDPHTWMSPKNLKIMAKNVYNFMCYTHPNDTSFFHQRLIVFERKMDELDHSIRTSLQHLPSNKFLIYHPSLGYFAQQYGLTQITVEHDGKAPSAAHFEKLIKLCKEQGVRTVFISQEHNGKAAQRIANELNVEPTQINPLDYNIDQQMLSIAKSLKK